MLRIAYFTRTDKEQNLRRNDDGKQSSRLEIEREPEHIQRQLLAHAELMVTIMQFHRETRIHSLSTKLQCTIYSYGPNRLYRDENGG